MIATISQEGQWMIGIGLVTAACAIVAIIIATIALLKKQEVKVDQPLEVQFAKEFVPHEAFHRHVAENKHEHENLFKKIGGVERGAGDRLDNRLDEMQKAGEVGRENLNKRINRISVGMARICGKLNVPMPGEDAEL